MEVSEFINLINFILSIMTFVLIAEILHLTSKTNMNVLASRLFLRQDFLKNVWFVLLIAGLFLTFDVMFDSIQAYVTFADPGIIDGILTTSFMWFFMLVLYQWNTMLNSCSASSSEDLPC
ncbi:MAG: hypothetical protein KAH86_01750 [Methanosarcinales archaeon]|nr:hypothetical protein [Methanosarcinales archaeon]